MASLSQESIAAMDESTMRDLLFRLAQTTTQHRNVLVLRKKMENIKSHFTGPNGLRHILQALLTPMIFAGILLTAIGFNFLSASDPETKEILETGKAVLVKAGLELNPLDLLKVLGPCKIVGVLSMHGIFGPFLQRIGTGGLLVSALCAAYGHQVVGQKGPLPAIFSAVMLTYLTFTSEKKDNRFQKFD